MAREAGTGSQMQRLAEGSDEIRLITILSASDSSEAIKCRTDTFEINSQHYTPEYQRLLPSTDQALLDTTTFRSRWKAQSSRLQSAKFDKGSTDNLPEPRYTWGDYLALSYTWGDPSDRCEIYVNGEPLYVTQNLARGLRVLRDKAYIKDGWKLWIDAICINQEDNGERATQVKRMREIYTKAWSPIIWLGASNDNSEGAIELVRTLSRSFTGRDAAVELTSLLRREPTTFGEGKWRALHQLAVRPYWRRAWILQEASLGYDDMPVLCGNDTLPWVDIHRAFWLLNKTDEVINIHMTREVEDAGSRFDVAIWNSLFVVGEIHKLQAEQSASQRVNLYRVLSLSRNVFATNPRDKIYGLLALMQDNLTRRVTPDYQAPVVDVYVDFAKASIDATSSLEILRHTSSNSELDLPSWVPDWTVEHTTSSLTLSNTLHCPSGSSAPVVQFLNEQKLSVKGFKVDTFDGMGCMWGRGWSPESVEQSSQALNPYGSEDGVREAIWRTMVADRDILVEPLQEDYSGLLWTPAILEKEKELDESNPMKELAQSNILEWGAKFLRGNTSFRVCGKPISSYLPTTYPPPEGQINPVTLRDALMARDRINVRRRMITTSRGYVGMALETCQKDDVICILLGCSMPMVLRPVYEDEAISGYKVVGECYIHGIMRGEAMSWVEAGECKLEDLVIL